MIYSIKFDPSVPKKARRIYAHLERERIGLGEKFFKELIECYSSIKTGPKFFQKRKGNFRHAFLRTMKYRIVFDLEEGTAYVYELRHTSRKPSRYGP